MGPRSATAAIVIALALGACVSWPDDVLGGDALVHSADGGTAPETPGSPVTQREGGAALPDAGGGAKSDSGGGRGQPCAAQTVTWTVDGSSCHAPSGDTLADGASRNVADEDIGDGITGKVTLVCDSGTLRTTNGLCSPPKTIDVSGPTGCIHGACAAAVGGCGTPDPSRAKAICVIKGYTDVTNFTQQQGAGNETQCNPDGSACFQDLNPTCNTVFTTVTCRY